MITLKWIAIAAVALYLVAAVGMALLQTRLIFPAWAVSGDAVPLPTVAERLEIDLPEGGQIVGTRLPATESKPANAAHILAFGGNAWNADVFANYLHAIFPDRDITVFHYRGYSPSDGAPSAQALLEDALLIHDRLQADRIAIVGVSIGTGPAAHLAAERPVAGTLLITPFDSLHALVRGHHPWLPVRALLRHEMEAAQALSRSTAPVAVIAAANDTLVPPRRTVAIREAAQTLVYDRTIAGTDHINIFDSPEFPPALREALERIEGASG
ncbi:alpha/beta hydrolase [Aestuariibius sp. 2305UL40-4]|uniref:alpha/beta hydrolase n=1 Tax=Aestuariibius violaceus TaxID=3234132 RepID=UPI00345E909B